MLRTRLHIDRHVFIGDGIECWITDVDSAGIRLVARGRLLGGPKDGEAFHSTYELLRAQSVHLGPHVVITLIDCVNDTARVDIFTPAHISVTLDEKAGP